MGRGLFAAFNADERRGDPRGSVMRSALGDRQTVKSLTGLEIAGLNAHPATGMATDPSKAYALASSTTG